MSGREKQLAMMVGGIVALGIAIFAIKAAFMKPLRELDKKSAVLRDKLEKVKQERRSYFTAEETVKRFTQRTFADQIDQASAKSGEMLTQQIIKSGLKEVDFSRLPVGPRKLRGANEIGWSVQGQGKLADVINLIFLLQNFSAVHRIENLTVTGSDVFGNVRVGFRFLTLVIDSPPVVDPVPLQTKVALDGPERRIFDSISSRDLLRPYLKRLVEKSPSDVEQPALRAGPASLRIVSLSEWMGAPEVHVRDLINQKTVRYKLGDELADGTIALVDYRPLPLPGNEGLKSFSRVILKVGAEYWAIERGQTLADKRRLSAAEIPDALPRL